MAATKSSRTATTLASTPEEPKKPSLQILKEEMSAGVTELERPAWGLFLSSFSAGLDVSFSVFLMGVMLSLVTGALPKPIVEILVAMAYSVGFLFIVLGRTELFTEHTTLAVLPTLNGTTSFTALMRLWAIVYVANILGGAGFAALAVYAGPHLGVIRPEVFGIIAHRMIDHPGPTIFVGGLLAGWLMGLLSWLVTASRDTIGQIAIVVIIASVIGFCHLQHPIVGSVEVLAGIFAGQDITWTDWINFLFWSTLGAAVGGTVFVAALKFSHSKFSQSDHTRAIKI